MQFSEKRNLTRWIIIISSFLIASLILWNTYVFFQTFKEEERNKMELWATALKNLRNGFSIKKVFLVKIRPVELSGSMKSGKIVVHTKTYSYYFI